MESSIIKELEITDNILNINTKITENKKEDEMEDFFATTISDIDEFDNDAWNKGNGFIMPHYPYITEKLEGLDSGLYLFAGKPNHGKSALMLNMMYDLCSNEENNLFGIYYSLDDSKKEIIPRIIAMDQRIPISVASKPKRYQNMIDNGEEGSYQYVELLEKRKIGLENLKNNVNKIKIEDSTKIETSDDIYNHLKKLITYLKAINPNYKIIVAIDSINDIRLPYKPKDNDILAEIARVVKRWSVEFDCVIFSSTHIRKLNGNRRPTIEDLKDSSVLVYEASVVFIIFNDVSENKQSAKIFQTNPNIDYKLPVLEIDWAKNKKSSYKGRSFCYFSPEFSKTIECDKEAIKRYDALIYSA